jgi:hypothetical protein
MPRARKSGVNTVNSDYIQNGVSVSPSIPSGGEKAVIKYDGILSKSGAAHVYARVGFGSSWDNMYDYPMQRSEMGFVANIPVLKKDTMNICFKDCANNWDNNSGNNYSFDVS